MKPKIIIYELNEIPVRLIEFYASQNPNSAIAHLFEKSRLYQTTTADDGVLSPWITWPTMHRGVPNTFHEISNTGQDLMRADQLYPSVFRILAEQGFRVGVFGCLQSYPVPNDREKYAFYVPDMFANSADCHPPDLSVFQQFNLSMVKQNGRNVTKGIRLFDALKFAARSSALGVRFKTWLRVVFQLCSEVKNKDRLVRRRSVQVELSFDLYLKLLREQRPDVSVFFTNHLASSMHRYWPALFPGDYAENTFSADWIRRWEREIPCALDLADRHLTELKNVAETSGADLILASSMGQAPVKDVQAVTDQVLIADLSALMQCLGIPKDEWTERLSMAPKIVVDISTKWRGFFLREIRNIEVNGHQIECEVLESGEVTLRLSIFNQDRVEVLRNGAPLDPDDMGISNIRIQDGARAYAYHIPKGVLMLYSDKNGKSQDELNAWHPISAIDFAPSLLALFGCEVPPYMSGKKDIFA